jgi:hypothetical protein
MMRQLESGLGRAAIDQAGTELDVPQGPAEGVLGVVVVAEGGVGRPVFPRQRPDALHRLQIRCTGRR